jgi:single-strand DNA-binding protein
MASFNRVILVGNVTRDIEIKYLQSGTAVADVGLAVNDRRKDGQTGQWIEETTFVDVVMWGRTAEVAGEYLSKGSSVLIEGRLKLDTWETDGQKRSKMRVVCERMQMLGGKGGGGGRSQGSQGQSYGDSGEYGEPESPSPRSAAPARSAPARQAPPPPDDDIPF